MDKIELEIKRIIGEVLEVDSKGLSENQNLLDDFGADQLDVVEILMTIEETFNISLSEDEVDGINTIGQLVKLVKDSVEKEGES